MNITITPQTKLDLYLIVETMNTQTRIDFGRNGIAGIEALKKWDKEPFTRVVTLYNRVAGQDVLVYQSTDVLPRWATAPARARLRSDRDKEALFVAAYGGQGLKVVGQTSGELREGDSRDLGS